MDERAPGRFERRGPRLVVAAVAVAAIAGGLWWGAAANDSSDGAPSVAQGTGAAGSGEPSTAPSSAPTTTPTTTPTTAPTTEPSAKPSVAPAPAATAAAGAAANVPDQKPVAPRKEVVLPAVGLDERADFGNEVTAQLVTSERIEGKGQGVGERSGPSLLVTVEITNSSAAEIDLDYIVINLYGPDDAPGQLLLGDSHSAPMSGKLAPKASRTGTYVLRLPDPTPREVTVTVNYGAETPTAVFTGKVST